MNNIAEAWPPNYTSIIIERIDRIKRIQKAPIAIVGAKEYYKTHPIEFIEDWCITYDPRNASIEGKPTTMPFILFDRQKEFVTFILSCLEDGENGLVEKCRDVGATWLCCAISAWLWLFIDGSAVGWGSRKEILVDKIGDPDSIFEKIRKILDNLPIFLMPKGYDPRLHSSHMKLINPESGNTITGEAGDNIGRGGRKLIYFKDESAHYERPEKIEASLGDNTDVQIDISSVNGTNNIFYRRRQTGIVWPDKQKNKTRVFVFDWRDHPNKTQEWYDNRKEKAASEGLIHVFSQEVDRDYAASVEGVVIPQIWVKAAIDAHKKLNIDSDGAKTGSLDVADSGGDKSCLTIRKGIILSHVDQWSFAEDVGITANTAITTCSQSGVNSLQYDCIGIGAGVKSEANRLKRDGKIKSIDVVPWDAGAKVINPDRHIIPGDVESPLNKDFYANLKAQAWWSLRLRFQKTYRMINGIEEYPHDELISIDSNISYFHETCNELSQPTIGYDGKGRLLVNKQPDGSKSPNIGDSVMQNYFPILKPSFFA